LLKHVSLQALLMQDVPRQQIVPAQLAPGAAQAALLSLPAAGSLLPLSAAALAPAMDSLLPASTGRALAPPLPPVSTLSSWSWPTLASATLGLSDDWPARRAVCICRGSRVSALSMVPVLLRRAKSKHMPVMQLRPLAHSPSLHAHCSLPSMQLGAGVLPQLEAMNNSAVTKTADARIVWSVDDVDQTETRVSNRKLRALSTLTNWNAFTIRLVRWHFEQSSEM
jgi:hypothetical protein